MKRFNLFFVGLLLLVVLGVAFIARTPDLSPSDDSSNFIIGCAFQEPGASINNNCYINARAMLNYDRFYDTIDNLNLGRLTRAVTLCVVNLKLPDIVHPGNTAPFDPVISGMPIEYAKYANECKKQVMAGYGVTVALSILPIKEPFLQIVSMSETLRDHINRRGGSPFAGDCPKPGSFTVQMTWTNEDGSPGGHSVMCKITEDGYCLKNGVARVTCYEHPDQRGGSYVLTINSGGYVTGGSGTDPNDPSNTASGTIPSGANVNSYTQ